MRQEQEEASEEVVEVAPGILRMQIPIQFTGLGHVNCYALEDGDGVAVVDPGMPGQESWHALEARLATAGIPIRRIHTIIVTHSHPDHFGAAGLLAERSGAKVAASDQFRIWWDADGGDETTLADADAGTEEPAPPEQGSLMSRPTPWGGSVFDDATPEQLERMEQMRRNVLDWFRTPRVSHELGDADRITLARREWVALYTPGHTDDHLCLLDPTTGVLLSGDHVLPSITPHISGLFEGDPLAQYFRSLDRVAAIDEVKLVLPAHGHPFTDLPGRVDDIKAHHDERLERLGEISSAQGWATVQLLSRKLFAPRAWGSMAESETYAHLEHLRIGGRAERVEEAGVLRYLVHS